MRIEELPEVIVEQKAIPSAFLKRYVIIDVYVPRHNPRLLPPELLLFNDGQNGPELQFAPLLNGLLETGAIRPVHCVGIHAGQARMQEYGTAGVLDYEGRGAKADAYQRFVLEELLPFIHTEYGVESFVHKAMAGFSLGGLSAMDLGWGHPDVFRTIGIFSGSLWWRTRHLDDGYEEERDRIMQAKVRAGEHHPGQRFYITTGSLDEIIDRNNNGIIDSIDDAVALIDELKAKGYKSGRDIQYVNYEDGKHDVPTWAKAFPAFLLWAFGGEQKKKKAVVI